MISGSRSPKEFVARCRALAFELEALALEAERHGAVDARDVERLGAAEAEWLRPGRVSGHTWHAIAAAMHLDRERTTVLLRDPGFDSCAPRTRAGLAGEAGDRIHAAVRRDRDGLARVPRGAWREALLKWQGVKERSRGRPTIQQRAARVAWNEILFDILKSAGLAAGTKTARNLKDTVNRAIRSLKASGFDPQAAVARSIPRPTGAAPAGSTSEEKLWEPPPHPSITDRQPRRT